MVSARTQRDPGRICPGVVDLDGMVALWGLRNLVRVVAPQGATGSVDTLKWSASLRKVTAVRYTDGCLRLEDREVGIKTTRREHQTNAVLEREGSLREAR